MSKKTLPDKCFLVGPETVAGFLSGKRSILMGKSVEHWWSVTGRGNRWSVTDRGTGGVLLTGEQVECY